MWAYKARDAIATAMHRMWGSFWIGFGILQLLFTTGALTEPEGPFPALGFWFIALAWITIMGAIAATAKNLALTAVLGTLALRATFAAIAELLGSNAWTVIAGYTFILSAICAWYTASALMFEGVAGSPSCRSARRRRPRRHRGSTGAWGSPASSRASDKSEGNREA